MLPLLAALSAIAPIAIDTYIPSMPSIASYFSVGIDKIEITLTIFLLGFAAGQLFGGPISDKIGRRKTSLFGLFGFAIFSFAIVFANDIYELWSLRFIEAFFGGLVVVNANATVRDVFSGKEAARVFTIIGTISMIAPLLAPVIGSFIIHFFTWKAIFVFIGCYSLVVGIMVYMNLTESYTYVKQNVFASYISVVTNIKARALLVVFAVIFSGLFIFISKSAFIYMEYFHVSSDFFPLFFGSDVIFVMIMARVNLRLIKKYEMLSIIKFALLMQVLISIVLVVDLIKPTLGVVFVFLTLHVSMLGLIFGNMTALILENFSKNAATATAVVGVVNFTSGAIVATIVTFFHDGSLFPSMIGIFITSLVSYILLSRYKVK